MTGSYYFKPPHSPTLKGGETIQTLDIDEFIEKSFKLYASYNRDHLILPRLSSPPYLELKQLICELRNANRKRTGNPYARLPDYQYWRRSIERVAGKDVDPVVRASFKITSIDKIATAGSCFAQHIAKTLRKEGYNYFVTEKAPIDLPKDQAEAQNYEIFSARFGNVYTARQMVQLINRAYGRFVPIDNAWQKPTGEYVDPFRPQIDPNGYTASAAVTAAREQHFSAVRAMIEQMDVFIFTLGLTESWRRYTDGAIFPLAPGVVAGAFDDTLYEFINFRVEEVKADLDILMRCLSQLNPRIRVILTVSPVPLMATYENRHVLVSTNYSKAVLCVAAVDTAKKYPNVDYFPSYEIITGNFNRGTYYEDDLRSVHTEGVSHVMRLFMKHYSDKPDRSLTTTDTSLFSDSIAYEIEQVSRVICDEERLDG